MQQAEEARLAEAQVVQAQAKGKAAEEEARRAAAEKARESQGRQGKKRGRKQGSSSWATVALGLTLAMLASVQLQSAGYVRLPGVYSDSSLAEAAQPQIVWLESTRGEP